MTPAVLSVNPNTTECGASTTVTITSASFYGVRSVSLDNGLYDLKYTVNSPSQITATIPASAPLGVHVITVTAAGGPSGRGFTGGPGSNLVSVSPTITRIDPASGPITGGTPVTVSGKCFNPTASSTQFLFGNAGGNQTSCDLSTTQCITYSPQVPLAGVVDVRASVQPSLGSPFALSPNTAADRFSYGQNPALIELLLPNAFFGIQSATIFLNGVAPQNGAGINFTSSDPKAVRMQPAIIIPASSNSVSFPLEFLPISNAEDVTLTATYTGSSVLATAHLVPWPPLTIMAGWANESPKRGLPTIAVTIFLSAFAPTGGAAVSLSSNPSVFPNQTVTINGSYWTTVTIPVGGLSTTTSVTITAAHNGSSASTSMVFLCTPKRPCPKGYYWNNIDCQCEQGKPQ